jgi:hypothetical protein
MELRLQGNWQEDTAGWANYIKPPALPWCVGLDRLLADFIDGLKREVLRHCQVWDFNARVIRDGLVTVHKMKIAAHWRPLELQLRRAGQPRPWAYYTLPD